MHINLLLNIKIKEKKMLEIDCKDYEHFEWLKENKNAYEDGIYDFTFEDRFIIYHANYKKTIEYFAYDKRTGYTSTINNMMTNKIYTEDEFKDMIPKILYSIKYTGDNRYITMFNSDPIEIIDTIFKTILPKYGYIIREEQIELSKTMYRGFTEKQVSICEAEVGTGNQELHQSFSRDGDAFRPD
jgi:ATP-dependent DNA helicase DinG